MKNQLFRLFTTMLVGGALWLPMQVSAANAVAAPVTAEVNTSLACTTFTQVKPATATTATAVAVDASAGEDCDGPPIESNVSWNSGGG